MSFIAGDIMIRMAADVASLKSDMDKAKSTVGDAVGLMKTAAIGLAGAFSATMFTNWIRGAIDAADEMNKLSARTGIAVEDIAGLQVAFQLGGAESGAFASSMARLSKQIVDGNAAFKTLGIETRNADGSIRGIKEILYDTADAFAEIEDGTAKSAMAVELFGKTGAELIPVLNAGSDGLREMDEMARKLGLSMSKDAAANAELFNDTLDLIGMGLQGVGRQVATQLLPTLSSLAGTFLETMTEGDRLAKVAEVIAGALKLLYSTAVVIIDVFVSLGKTIGAAGAQLVAVMNGDFAQAAAIGREWSADMRKDWTGTAQTLEKVWSDSGGKTVESMAKTQGALRKLTLATQEQEEANKKAAEAAAKHNAELDKAAEAVRLELAGYSGDLLTKLQRLAELRDTNRISTEEYTKAVQDLLSKQPVIKKAAEEEQKWLEILADRQLKAIKAYEDKEAAIDKGIASAEDMIRAIERETQQLGLSNTEREISNALLALEKAGLEKGSEAYNIYAEKIRAAVVDREAVRASIDNAREVADEWTKLTDQINQSLTDSLFRAFESGANFFTTFWDSIKNTLKTTVLKILMQPVMAGVSAFTSMLGFPGVANASTGAVGGNALSTLISGAGNFFNGSMISSSLGGGYIRLGDFLSTSNNNTLAGIGDFMQGNPAIGQLLGMGGNAFAGYGIGKGLNSLISGGYGVGAGNSFNNIANIGAGVASAFFGPIGGAVVGAIAGTINRAFGRKLTDQGIQGTFQGGEFGGNSYQFYKGGWFRSDKTKLGDLDASMGEALSAGSAAMYAQVRSYAEALKLPAESLKDVSYFMKVSLTDDAEKNKQAIADAINAYGDALAAQFTAAITPFQRAGESIIETMQRLVVLQGFSENINRLGGVFSTIASSSIEARESLIEMAGGIDALMGRARSFVENFYSAEEQAGLSARAIADALQAVGLSGTDLATREDFRALVESRNVETQQGREQLLALLDIGPQFAQLSDYIRDNNISFAELVDRAPDMAVLESILGPTATTAEATQQMADNIASSTESLANISTRIDSIAETSSAAVTAANAAATAASAAADAATAAINVVRDATSSLALAAAAPNYQYDIGVSR